MGGCIMAKLYYIKCCDEHPGFICDVTDDFGKANLLKKEYEQDDPAGKYKVQYSPGELEIVVTKFNQERMKKYLNKTLQMENTFDQIDHLEKRMLLNQEMDNT